MDTNDTNQPETQPDPSQARCGVPICSAQTALSLYAQLEYYREYVPYMLGISHEQYADKTEAKITDAALAAYRKETGAKPAYPILPNEKGDR